MAETSENKIVVFSETQCILRNIATLLANDNWQTCQCLTMLRSAYTVSQKTCQHWSGRPIARNYKDRFSWHLAEICKMLKMFQLSCRFSFFKSSFRLSDRTPKIVQGSYGSLKVLEFVSGFSRPGKSLKTDMVLESPWIYAWRSLKVFELDFLKRRDRTSDCF